MTAVKKSTLALGDVVQVVGEHAADWQGVSLYIAGISVLPGRGLRYTTSENWPPSSHGELTDDWKPEHLSAAPPPLAADVERLTLDPRELLRLAGNPPIVDQDGNEVGRLDRMALGELYRVHAYVDEAGTVWTPPTAWAYRQACLALSRERAAPLPSRERLGEAVAAAMQDAWDEICDDTGCHPVDIQQLGRRRLRFSPNHWADLIALRLSEALASVGEHAQREDSPQSEAEARRAADAVLSGETADAQPLTSE